MEAETLKLLGKLEGHAVKPLAARMSAHCNRVRGGGRAHGVRFHQAGQSRRRASETSGGVGGVQAAGRAGSAVRAGAAGGVGAAGRPSAAAARPQSRQGHGGDGGAAAPCSLLDWKFTVLSHNTIRGAAGATILNAELLASLGKLEPVAVSGAR